MKKLLKHRPKGGEGRKKRGAEGRTGLTKRDFKTKIKGKGCKNVRWLHKKSQWKETKKKTSNMGGGSVRPSI